MKLQSLLLICAVALAFTGCTSFEPVWTATCNSRGEKLPIKFQPQNADLWDEILPKYLSVNGNPVLVRENGRTTASIKFENSPSQAVSVFYKFRWLDKNGQEIGSATSQKEYKAVSAGGNFSLSSDCNDSEAAD